MRMKFLADENIEKPIIEFLKTKGHDVFAVADHCPGTADEDILKIANQESRILVTNDKDFGELIFLQEQISSGILLIRSGIETSEAKVELLTEVLQKIVEKIPGNFVVLYENGYRIRSLRGGKK